MNIALKPWLAGLSLMLAAWGAQASTSGVVISQVYGGGGNTGATLRNDFIELFNAGSAPVSLAGWSVQYAATAGTSWNVATLPAVTLAPGQYHLVQGAAGGGGSASLPAPDTVSGINMAAANGKLALVSSSTALSGTTPVSAAIVDLVGWGTATAFEGSAAASPTGNTIALLRQAGGCTDSDSNANDFVLASANPRNAAAPLAPCGVAVAQPIVPNCPAGTVLAASGGDVVATATDADSRVNAAAVVGSLPPGFSLGAFEAATATGGIARQTINVAAGQAPGNTSLTLAWNNDSGQSASCTLAVTLADLTPIFAIQGRDTGTSPLLGQTVTTRGVVTLITNNGFFLQDPVGDGDPLSSDGIFVFSGTPVPAVLTGQRVQLSGRVAEFNTGAATNADTLAHTVTELTSPAGITVLDAGHVIQPVVVNLPETIQDELEHVEGMLVTLNGPLTVSQNFFLGRFGQLTLSANGRMETPTNRHRPGPDAQALADANARARILLDDGSSLQNPNPTPYLGAANTVRAGDTVAAITGVIDYGLATSTNTSFGDYKIHPTVVPVFARANPRSTAPDAVGGNVRVASMNVLNYFTTFTDGTTADGQSGQGCSLGGAVAAANCRGANSLAEFGRQQTKIVEAIAALDADVVGLMELQNNGATAVGRLVAALNARLGAGTYAAVPDPATGTGTDAIKVAMIYKAARLQRMGTSRSHTDPIHNRPPLAQTFAAANGERFSVIVNHFKSKGCDGAVDADLDQGDGQGCFNDRRVQQARALGAFIDQVRAVAGDDDVLLIGDLNAYAKEDPVDLLTDAAQVALVDLVARHNTFGYSYVFDGAAGRLDHALATGTLAAQATGTLEWHINADEPSVLDYNLEFKQPACAACGPDYYSATPYRSSDHDPVLVGLALYRALAGTAGRDTLVGSAGDDRITGGEGADTLTGGTGRDIFVYRSPRDTGDTITDFLPGEDRIDVSALLAALQLEPTQALSAGLIRWVNSAQGLVLQIDADGLAGPGAPRAIALLRNVSAGAFVPARDLILQ